MLPHVSQREEEEEEKAGKVVGTAVGPPVSLIPTHTHTTTTTTNTFPTDGCVGFRLLLTDLYT